MPLIDTLRIVAGTHWFIFLECTTGWPSLVSLSMLTAALFFLVDLERYARILEAKFSEVRRRKNQKKKPASHFSDHLSKSRPLFIVSLRRSPMSSSTASSSAGSADFEKSGLRPKRFIKGPDDKATKVKVAELNDEIKKLNLANDEVNAKIEKVVADPKLVGRKTELQKELKEVIAKQGASKQERTGLMDQIKLIDQQLKRKINEIQAQTAKSNFKNVQEIDARINHLDAQIDEGSLKLADERRFVKEMSLLRKLRKDFGSIEKVQELIEQDRAKIADLKKKLNAIQNKDLQARFETIQKELNELNAENKSTYDKRQVLFDERTRLRKLKDEKYSQIKKLRLDLDAEYAKFKAAMAAEKKKRDEEYKLKQAEDKATRRREAAEAQLAEASIPAFSTEINSLQVLLNYFDPSYEKPIAKEFAALNKKEDVPTRSVRGRTIEMPEDAVIIKKEQETYFFGSQNTKKSVKGKKLQKPKSFTVDSDVILGLSDLSIPLPTKQEDVPATIETLKETLTALQDKQEEQTKLNIERAKAKIAKIEAEEDKKEAEAKAEVEEPVATSETLVEATEETTEKATEA